MEFRLLGPVEVLGDDGAQLQVGGRRPRALLAMLLLHANEPVSTDRLIDGIWGESPPASGAGALQVHVHALRKALGADRIVTRPPGYQVRLEPGELDIDRFEQLVAAGELHDALALWRGPALADVAYEEFARAAALRLDESRLAAIEARIDADLEAGRHASVVGELDSLVAVHPHRERLQGQRILALYRSGRQADALAAYRDARAALDELGLEPSPGLRALERRILEHDPTLAPAPEVAVPSSASALIGRERELAAVTALLGRDDVSLVTLTGIGGTGKTSLAREAAKSFPEHTFVDLSPVGDAALVMPTVARALAVEEDPGRPVIDAIADRLSGRSRLLLLDNLEHVPGAHADVGRLLARAPETTVLATSRSPLRLAGEREFRVSPLPLPELGESSASEMARSPAARLYVERARESLPEFVLRDENANAVGRICRALDGLPLAIELAAARVRVLGPEQTARRLGEGLSLLRRRAPDLPERQQSLQATIDWSYDLLEPAAQSVFRALGVFAGAATLAAVETVSGDDRAADALESLLDAGLVTHHVDPTGNPSFGLLETLRAYAAAALAAEAETEARTSAHTEFHVELVERVERERSRSPLDAAPHTPSALAEIDAAYPEILTAIANARRSGDRSSALRLTAGMRAYWRARQLFEDATIQLEHVVASLDADAPVEAAETLSGAAFFAYWRGEWERARDHGRRAVAIFDRTGNDEWAARTRQLLAAASNALGEPEAARAYCVDAARYFRAAEHWYGLTLVLGSIAEAARRAGDLDGAAEAIREALDLRARHGDETLYCFNLVVLAGIHAQLNEHGEASLLIAESFEIAIAHDDVESIPPNLFIAAGIAARTGQPETAALLLGAAETALRKLGDERYEMERAEYFEPVERIVSDALGAERLGELRTRGLGLELGESSRLAIGLATVGS